MKPGDGRLKDHCQAPSFRRFQVRRGIQGTGHRISRFATAPISLSKKGTSGLAAFGSSDARTATIVRTSDWKALGHSEIEQEHRALDRIVRELESVVARWPQSDITAFLEQLAAYSTYHFRSEEAAMRAARFPDLETHTRQHKEFTAKITLLHLQPFRADQGPELLYFVKRWFRVHTMGADERFAEFLRRRAA